MTLGSKMTYVPLSVEYGNRRKKLGWWLKGRREALALWLAPWFKGPIDGARNRRPTVYLIGGPRNGTVIRDVASAIGVEAHYPGHENDTGRYVLATGSCALGSAIAGTHVVYVWEDDS